MKLRPFEIGLVILFVALAIGSLVILSIYEGGGKSSDDIVVIGPVTIWGTIPQEVMNETISKIAQSDKQYSDVTYRYYSPEQFDSSILNALADGNGPDLVLLPHEKLVDMRRRIQPVSYESFPLVDLRNMYIDGAEIFALNDGLYAYPIAVDPLMMYWNRDILSTEGFLTPPTTWEALLNSYFPKLIKRDFDRSIVRSVVAMGEYDNVRNSFAIMSALLLQSGSNGVIATDNGRYQVQLQEARTGNSNPLRVTADFYTRFSKPSNTLYSWNRAFRDDRSVFIAENLAFYFGYGSEARELERINPNLNFDVAEIPQGASDTLRRTYGKFYGISILNSSDNKLGASTVMFNLAGLVNSEQIAMGSNMVPVRRNSIAGGSNDKYGRVIYQSASVALGWLNPDREATDRIFSTMTGDINENRRDLSQAVNDSVNRLEREY